jgi:hypothetical protein
MQNRAITAGFVETGSISSPGIGPPTPASTIASNQSISQAGTPNTTFNINQGN